jgi:DNA-binding beta-propeller fold protein YncE
MHMPLGAALRSILGGVLICLGIDAQSDEAQPLLTLERTIPLTKVAGRIDHMAVGLRRGRLFVAELGNNTVDVVDLAAASVVHRINGLGEPQGIGYSPDADVIAVANAGDGSVRLYQGGDFAPAGRADLGDDADNVRLDPRTGKFLVGYGSGGIATLDSRSGAILAKAALPAHPEGFRVDKDGGCAWSTCQTPGRSRFLI